MNRFLTLAYRTFLSYLFIAFGFFIFRVVYTLRFSEGSLLQEYSSDLVEAFLVGWKYDTLVICFGLALPAVLMLFLAFVKNNKFNNVLDKFLRYFISFVALLLFVVLVLDQQFYSFFQSHLNVIAFGFIDDDTGAVMKSMWTDHPVILILICLLAIGFVTVKIIKYIWTKVQLPKGLKNLNGGVKIALSVLFYVGFAHGLRGNLTEVFPLSMDDSIISKNRFINKVALNGVYTFMDATKSYKESLEVKTKAEVLAYYGYSSEADVLADYFGIPASNFIGPDFEKYLFQRTIKDSVLAQKKYNVVFILMESLGSYYLNFHSEELNLLGEFEKHLNEGYLFTNFLSSTRGTIYSLENIMINKSSGPISNTSLRFNTYNSSVAYPYHNAGYESSFIYGGKIGWRNLSELVPAQYFDQAYGQSVIMKKNENARKNTWGVYDQYMFDDIFSELTKPSEKPKMIFALSTTNHTPYELPDDYEGFPVNVSDSVMNLIFSNKSIADLSFRAYQYSNHFLGKFLTDLKNSPYGENTIVAVTGDHNSYALFPFDAQGLEEINNHRVPFFLYLPEDLKKEEHEGLLDRYSSHKDMFTTLFNLTLSDQAYFSLGNDLLDANLPDSLFYGINDFYHVGNEALSKEELDKKVRARDVLIQWYFAK